VCAEKVPCDGQFILGKEAKKMKEYYGYSVIYHRFKNAIHNKDILMVWTYYKGKLIECIAYADGKRLSI